MRTPEHVPDDRKRTEIASTKLTERMELDLDRLLAVEDRTMSDYLFRLIRRDLYGQRGRLDELEQSTK